MAGPSHATSAGAKAHAHHPIHIHPARPLYRFAATGLGAAMWFFVRLTHLNLTSRRRLWDCKTDPDA